MIILYAMPGNLSTHDEANFIWECITGLAYDFRETINNKLKEQNQ